MVKIAQCSNRPVLTSCELEGLSFQVDPYIGCNHLCRYCYALEDSETDWSEEILIHQDIVGQLKEELAGVSPQRIYLGYHTDPYQPCEEECHQTRKVLELLAENGFSASILTKSDLILRDMAILKEMPDASVSVSVAFNEDPIRRMFEANTLPTENRVEVLRQMNEAGIGARALICPVIPLISDVEELLETIAPYTEKIWIYGLSVRDDSARWWTDVRDILKEHFTDIAGEIEAAILSRDHDFWQQLRARLVERQKTLNPHLSINI
ncbi:MAG: radical SAM protein [bacterium]|nr:radical SAM protein [bacterium]